MSQIGFGVVAVFSAAWLAVRVMALLIGVLGLWLVPVACLLGVMSCRVGRWARAAVTRRR
jgi:spore maturation protein SpmA